MQPALGRLAQLVEHALDVRRVSGSSPLSSTTYEKSELFPLGMCSDFLFSKTFPNDVYALRIFQSLGFSFLTATGRFTVLDVSLPIDCIGTHLVQTAGATVDTKINA